MTPPATIARAFTPTGKLRAAINLGNPILAVKDAATGAPFGVSVDLARGFAERLGVDVEFVVFDNAAKSVEAVKSEAADIGFFAVDPLRSAGIAFTAPYVLIEGAYLVPQDSPLQHNDEVDSANHRVAVGKGSAYDLFLSRELKHAQIVRAATPAAVISTFLDQQLEVIAGIKQQLQAEAALLPGLRLLPGRFMVIQQAMGLPMGRGAAAAALAQYVEEAKASGLVAQALVRHGIQGAAVAPAVKIEGSGGPQQ